MANNSREPREFDAVKGGRVPPPVSGAVLGGIEGLRQQYINGNSEQSIEALNNALNYGEAGVELLIEALDNSRLIVRANAYKRLSSFN